MCECQGELDCDAYRNRNHHKFPEDGVLSAQIKPSGNIMYSSCEIYHSSLIVCIVIE